MTTVFIYEALKKLPKASVILAKSSASALKKSYDLSLVSFWVHTYEDSCDNMTYDNQKSVITESISGSLYTLDIIT